MSLERVHWKAKAGLQFLAKGVLNLIYPPLCIHCHGEMLDDAALLCSDCLPLLQLIEAQERCPVCFRSRGAGSRSPCRACAMGGDLHFDGIAAAFDYIGPAASLIRKMKYGNQPNLARGMAALMITQFLKMEWPIPDLVIPVPITLTHWIQRGYNQSALLAKEIGALLNRPVREPLLRRVGDFSQAGLSKDQRILLSGDAFSLKKEQQLQDRCLLLVDDVMTTGSTLRHCGELLLEECPSRLFAITFCKAVE
jgi:competence protein ComFC